MKLLLRDDVEGVGKKGDVVEVSPGYGRNFLMPKGLAQPATPGVEAQAEGMRRARNARDARDREAAEEVARVLVSRAITVAHRAGEGGRLFGSVTAPDIAGAVAEQTGYEVDRKRVQLEEPIKSVGTHVVTVRLHSEVEFPLTVEVVEG